MTQQHLLLLSGLLCDATVWSRISPGLREQASVQILDFRGFDDIGAMARHVLDQAPPRFALAGHSMGARVALEVCRLAPGRVQRLALLDTGVHPARPGEQESRQRLVDLAATAGMHALAEQWLPPMMRAEHTTERALMDPLMHMVEGMDAEVFAGQVRALLNRPDASAQLAHIHCPTLVGVGRQDRWSPVEQHQGIARAIAHATLAIFEDSGHMAPFENPAAVLMALQHWLHLPSEVPCHAH